MWTRLVRISDPAQWFGKIHEPVTRVQHLVRTNSYVNATVSLVRRYGAVVCMKKRELTQDPDCTLALQHVLDLLTWASYPGQIFPVWTQVNIADDNLMMWNIWTTDPGTICEHGLRILPSSLERICTGGEKTPYDWFSDIGNCDGLCIIGAYASPEAPFIALCSSNDDDNDR